MDPFSYFFDVFKNAIIVGSLLSISYSLFVLCKVAINAKTDKGKDLQLGLNKGNTPDKDGIFSSQKYSHNIRIIWIFAAIISFVPIGIGFIGYLLSSFLH